MRLNDFCHRYARAKPLLSGIGREVAEKIQIAFRLRAGRFLPSRTEWRGNSRTWRREFAMAPLEARGAVERTAATSLWPGCLGFTERHQWRDSDDSATCAGLAPRLINVRAVDVAALVFTSFAVRSFDTTDSPRQLRRR
tara:strand:+ start:283 stop:699 length:417 start_codon:yes stop_codon:yes gene_type:complete